MAGRRGNSALDALYDLHEMYLRTRGLSYMCEQDDSLESLEGGVVGGLALARGAKSHSLVTFSRANGWRELPWGSGPFEGGWIWKEHVWSSAKFARRAAWFETHVKWRRLWQPRDDAQIWFRANVASSGTQRQQTPDNPGDETSR